MSIYVNVALVLTNYRTKKSESYLEVLNDTHDNRIINNETLDNILNDKNYIKEKDDFEL